MTVMMNPAAEMSQMRSTQTLAMSAPAAAPAAAPTNATAPAGSAEAAAAAAAAPGAAADAAAGAQAVQPPATGKIIMQSVLKGAMSGASVAMGIKQFGPLLMKFGPIAKLIGSAAPPAGLIGFISKVPVLGKVLPLLGKTGLAGFAIAGLMGAAVGAIAGFVKGRGAAKKAAEEYATAQAAAQAQAPVGNPVVPTPAPAEAPAPEKAKAAPVKPRFKSWVVARSGSKLGTQKFGHYTTKGESMKDLCARFHTTPAEIRKLNPSVTGDSVPAGTKLKLARKVVPNATAWKG